MTQAPGNPLLSRILGAIEKVGNALPHPATLVALLGIGVGRTGTAPKGRSQTATAEEIPEDYFTRAIFCTRTFPPVRAS